MPVENTIDLISISNDCVGYVGADLKFLCNQAALEAMKMNKQKNELPIIRQNDFIVAINQ